jgi:PKD repeat protein
MRNMRFVPATVILTVLAVAVLGTGCPSGPRSVSVPDCAGKTRWEGEGAIEDAGLTVGVLTEAHSDTAPMGNVVGQEPAADSSVAKGSAVNLVLSLGPDLDDGVRISFAIQEDSSGLGLDFAYAVPEEKGAVVSQQWDFGEPASGALNASADPTPAHTYAAPGTYTVTLTATTAGSDTLTESLEVVLTGVGATLFDNAVITDAVPDLTLREIGPDSLVFDYPAKQGLPFQLGDVLVGGAEGGYLREITNLAVQGNTIAVTTEQASLADALAEGGLDLQIGLTAEDFAKAGYAVEQKGKATLVNLSGKVLYQRGGVKLFLEQGSVECSPDMDLDADWSLLSGLEHAEVVVNLPVTATMEAKFQANQKVTLEDEIARLLPPIKKRFATAIGFLPVFGTVTFELHAGFTAELKAEGSFSAGYQVSVPLSAGASYTDGANPEWTSTGGVSVTGSAIEPVARIAAEASLRPYLRPSLKIEFYNVVGPYGGLEPFLRGKLAIASDAPETVTVDAGVDAYLGFSLEIFDEELRDEIRQEDPEAGQVLDDLTFDKKWDFTGPTLLLYRWKNCRLQLNTDRVTLTPSRLHADLIIQNSSHVPDLPAALVERREHLLWEAKPSDPRIHVNPINFIGDGTEVGDTTGVRISVDAADYAGLVETIAAHGVKFENDLDLFGFDRKRVIVELRECDPLHLKVTPTQVALNADNSYSATVTVEPLEPEAGNSGCPLRWSAASDDLQVRVVPERFDSILTGEHTEVTIYVPDPGTIQDRVFTAEVRFVNQDDSENVVEVTVRVGACDFSLIEGTWIHLDEGVNSLPCNDDNDVVGTVTYRVETSISIALDGTAWGTFDSDYQVQDWMYVGNTHHDTSWGEGPMNWDLLSCESGVPTVRVGRGFWVHMIYQGEESDYFLDWPFQHELTYDAERDVLVQSGDGWEWLWHRASK